MQKDIFSYRLIKEHPNSIFLIKEIVTALIPSDELTGLAGQLDLDPSKDTFFIDLAETAISRAKEALHDYKLGKFKKAKPENIFSLASDCQNLLIAESEEYYPILIEIYQELLKAMPGNDEVLTELAFCYFIEGTLEDAGNTYEAALEANPENKKTLSDYSFMLQEIAYYDEAEEIIKRLKKLSPFEGSLRLSLFYLMLGKKHSAKKEWKFCLQNAPDDIKTATIKPLGWIKLAEAYGEKAGDL